MKVLLTLCIHEPSIIVVDAEPESYLEYVTKEDAKLSKGDAHQEESVNNNLTCQIE